MAKLIYILIAVDIIFYVIYEFEIVAFRDNKFFKNISQQYNSLTFGKQYKLLWVLCGVIMVSFFLLDIIIIGYEDILNPPASSFSWRYDGFPTEPGYWAILVLPIFLVRKMKNRNKNALKMSELFAKRSLWAELKETVKMVITVGALCFYAVVVYVIYNMAIDFLYNT